MSRIHRQGADWLSPYAPQTAWQRERARGVLQPMPEPSGWSKGRSALSRARPEDWWALVGFILFVAVVMIAWAVIA